MGSGRLPSVLSSPELSADPEYHPWDWYVRHEPLQGFTREEWWTAVRLSRGQTARPTPFAMTDGAALTYNLPDSLTRPTSLAPASPTCRRCFGPSPCTS